MNSTIDKPNLIYNKYSFLRAALLALIPLTEVAMAAQSTDFVLPSSRPVEAECEINYQAIKVTLTENQNQNQTLTNQAYSLARRNILNGNLCGQEVYIYEPTEQNEPKITNLVVPIVVNGMTVFAEVNYQVILDEVVFSTLKIVDTFGNKIIVESEGLVTLAVSTFFNNDGNYTLD